MTVRRSQPIAEKVLSKIQRYQRSKVVDMKVFRAGKQTAEYMAHSVTADAELAKLPPAHAIYVYAQNRLSVMAEQLLMLKELDRLSRTFNEASELYTPVGPPMSPLTTSFYTCWSLFDVAAGLGKETLATIAMAVGRRMGMHEELLRLFGNMQASCMAIYRHEGIDREAIILRDLVTEQVFRVICAAGYQGKEGELWYVRVFPPPGPEFEEHVVFTTPYLLINPSESEWRAYFARTLPDGEPAQIQAAYTRHMKYGPSRLFWTEFVFEAFVNFRTDVIFLEGLPDVAESRPHSPVGLHNRH